METRTEMKKIGIACGVGGVIGTAVALICAPMFWWLGMLAGFGAGYLCCDPKEVWGKIPLAWQIAKKETRFRSLEAAEAFEKYRASTPGGIIGGILLDSVGCLFCILLLPFLCFFSRDAWVLVGKLLWALFKFIHSQKRVLCGIDSAIGVAIAYISLGTNAATLQQKVIVVICGGIIGAAIGILNYEVVSKRLLRLAPT